MSRAIAALFCVPLLASAAFGFYFLFAAPVMLATSALCALPLLLALRKLRRLDWWHAGAAGTACGAVVALLYWYSSPVYHVETAGAANVLVLLGMGTGLGIAFWFIGILGNPEFPFVATRLPGSMWLVVPIALAGLWLHQRLVLQLGEGRVTAVLSLPGPDPEQPGLVRLRLRSKEVVEAVLPVLNDTQPPLGHCFVFETRWALMQTHKRYFIIAPKLGEQDDDC